MSFPLYALGEEHEELRAAIRALAEKEIAPYAADVDEEARFPYEALKALNATGFNAVHIGEDYGGQGGDAVAACIVIEEIARVDASASLIPAVNKLGTQPIILSGSDVLKKRVLPDIAAGAMASYGLSERELIDHVKGRIARYKAPRRIVFGDCRRPARGRSRSSSSGRRPRPAVARNIAETH